MTDTVVKPDSRPVPVAVRPGAYARIVAMRAMLFIILGMGGIWLVVNFAHSPTQFFNSAVLGLSNGALYALIALGYTLVYGIIELINFAHGDLFMLGSFAALTVVEWTITGKGHLPVPVWLGLLLALIIPMMFCATLNVVIERVAYRRLRNAPRLAPLISAIGVSFMLVNVGLWWRGPSPQNFPAMLSVFGRENLIENIFGPGLGAKVTFSYKD